MKNIPQTKLSNQDWEFLKRLNKAFDDAEEHFGRVGKIFVNSKVFDNIKNLPPDEWNEAHPKHGNFIGRIWDADIYLDDSLVGNNIILEGEEPESTDSASWGPHS